MRYLPISKERVPYRAQFRIDGRAYDFHIRYNYYGDYFTLDLYSQGELIIAGEKVLYGKALFDTYRADVRFPKQAIIPISLSTKDNRAGWQEVSESTFLYMPSSDDLGLMADE